MFIKVETGVIASVKFKSEFPQSDGILYCAAYAARHTVCALLFRLFL